MDYLAHYNRLIDRAKARVLSGYVETHHVVPRCVGGSDDRANLVQLTAEEHYVAHQLLHKIHPKNNSLMFAVIAMTGNPNGKRNNKVYGWMRVKSAALQSDVSLERWADPEYREKHRIAMDAFRSDPVRVQRFADALSKANKGRVKSEQERLNIAEAGRKRARRKFSEDAKRNMAEARRKTWEQRRANGTHLDIAAKTKATRIANGSYEFSDEHRAAIGESAKGRVPWNKGKKLK